MLFCEIGGRRYQVKTSWVAASVGVVRAVQVGNAVRFWSGAVIQAEDAAIKVGVRTSVHKASMLHSDARVPLTTDEDCTACHHSIVHGYSLGGPAFVAMRAPVLEGAVVGDHCVADANAHVRAGNSFARGSLTIRTSAPTGSEFARKAIDRLPEPAASHGGTSALRSHSSFA